MTLTEYMIDQAQLYTENNTNVRERERERVRERVTLTYIQRRKDFRK